MAQKKKAKKKPLRKPYKKRLKAFPDRWVEEYIASAYGLVGVILVSFIGIMLMEVLAHA